MKRTAQSRVSQLVPPEFEMCAASYQAEQVPGAVIIFAHGIHNTSGFRVFFKQLPIEVYPPEFSLWHSAPSGIVLQVITPFSIHVALKATETVKVVVIHDANGRHKVRVEPAPDFYNTHMRRIEKGGPYIGNLIA